jgi:ATP-dependent DNA helicase RecQ
MRRVSGVGDRKLADFGPAFLQSIKVHCLRTGLPSDVPFPTGRAPAPAKPPAKMSPKKDLAFRQFRSGAPVADVAKQLDLTRTTVVEYLAEFIAAEKPASIFRWVPEDVCERVAAAAETHGTARLKPVFLELNEEVSYDDIRIVFAFLAARE